MRVRRVKVTGNRATIRDRDLIVPPELRDLDPFNAVPMRLRRVDGRWRIDEIG